jgi:hypothetical protein
MQQVAQACFEGLRLLPSEAGAPLQWQAGSHDQPFPDRGFLLMGEAHLLADEVDVRQER